MLRYVLVGVIAVSWGCAAGAGPAETAEEFWLASKDGDMDRARELVLSSSTAEIQSPDGESQIGDFVLGETEVDGDHATVATTLSGIQGLDRDLSFNTVLGREDGMWKIDLDQTMSSLTTALLGTSMEEMAGQMGEAMGKAMGEVMEGMAEGMAEGMRAVGDSLAAATEREPDRR